MEEPEVGAVIDGFRFKGGDPAQESSWEQVEAIDVSGQWGPGAMQLPNGSVVRYGPHGGTTVLQSAAQAAAANGEGSQASALVGAEARARFMINLGPLVEAQGILEGMEQGGYSPNDDLLARGLEAIPFDGGFAARVAGGEDYNAYTQAAKTFEAAIMPIMSGAAVTPSEAQRLIRAAIPQPGDSPEVLAQKSRQRRMMINAVAQGIGQEAPFGDPVLGETTENDLPSYPGVADAAGGARDMPLPSAGGGGAPPSGPQEPIDISGMSAAELLELEPGQAIRMPDGTVTRLTGAPRVGAEGREVSPGVFAAEQTPEEAIAARREDTGISRRLDAFTRGAADMMTLGFSDEIAAGLDTVIPLNQGMTGWEAGFGPAYRHNIQRERGFAEADREDMPATRMAGQFAGAVGGGAAAVRGATALPQALRVTAGQPVRNVIRQAGAGSALAFGAGAGNTEGNALQRVQAGANPVNLGLGAVAGPVGDRVARAAAPVISGGVNALARGGNQLVQGMGRRGWESLERNPLATALDRFGARSSNVNALSEAQRFRSAGVEPTLVDVTDAQGRAVLRSTASRQTPSRGLAEDFATGRQEAMPSRVAGQARRHISGDTRTPDQITEELTARRSGLAREEYAAPYAQRVPVPEEVSAVLTDAPGQAALRAARADAVEIRDATAIADIDALLSGQAQDVSAATLDRVQQAMRERGVRFARGSRNARAAGAFQRREAIDTALDEVPGLQPARDTYRELSGQIEAVGTGQKFMGQNPDEFVAAVQAMTPEQRAVARAAAARQVEIRGQTTGSAPGVARNFATNPELRRQTTALIGEEGAEALGRGMRAESDALARARAISPQTGSQTALRLQDDAMVDGALEGAGAVAQGLRGDILGAGGRILNMWRGRGFSDAEAEALVAAAIDTSQTDQLIEQLTQRMSRREARNLVRTTRYMLSQNAGELNADR